MPILASLCNIGAGYKSGLILFDDDLNGYKYLQLPAQMPGSGITGIALTEGEIILASQGGCIAVLDRKTFTFLYSHVAEGVRNAHSALAHAGSLYVVMTAQNGVIAFDMNRQGLTKKRWHWRDLNAFGSDIHHLNSICAYNDMIVISGFGKKESVLWSSAKNGYVLDTKSGKKLYEGLCQPHSLTSLDGSLLICESAKARVLDLASGKNIEIDGYLRGLCRGPRGIYVAGSKGRTVSKSTGLVVTNPDEGGEIYGRSAIYRLDRDAFKPQKSKDLGDLEIYDLVFVGDEANNWSVLDIP